MKTLKSLLSTLAFLVLCLSLPDNILGHGRFWDPCARNSLWRKDPSALPDYNDMEKNCGGFSTQMNNGDRCGACGDPYQLTKARDSENTGLYGGGTIVRTFEAGKTYPFTCEFTATHMGYYTYEYQILPNSSAVELDDNIYWTPLRFASDGNTTRTIPVNAPNGMYKEDVMIPEDLVADRCVIRWKYVSGNSWGTCTDGTGAMGCGPQETFYGCSDCEVTAPSSSVAKT